MKKLTRSTTDVKMAGVCGGLGEYFSCDPLIFRILFLVAIVGYGTGMGVYLLLWLLLPKN